MTPFAIGQLAGSIAIIYLLSRLMLWFTRSWPPSIGRLVFVYLFLIILVGLLSGMGHADGSAFAPWEGLRFYIPAAAAWFFFDVWRLVRRRSKVEDEIEIRKEPTF